MKYKNPYALVLGGYVNGYNIIRELYECGVRNIALFDYGKRLASFSNKIKYFHYINKTPKSLKNAILKLKNKEKTDYIVIFPTDDIQLENLYIIYNEIKKFCFIPFNYNNILESLKKDIQYKYCEKFGIPYPKTLRINTINDLEKIETIMFPIFIKPNKFYGIEGLFRGLLLNNLDEYYKNKNKISPFLKKGVTFLATEYIPGDDSNIYSYVAYRNQKGEILNEWIGRKLSQYPDNFGVFSTASNEGPEIIRTQGRKLLEVMDLIGICEPEFKYDFRDGKYKLMEITLRSTMWNGLGAKSGVFINYSLYLDALGKKVPKYFQINDKKIHFIYMKHEILNLIFRKGYWKHFKHNVFGGDKRYFAVYNKEDIKPFLYDLIGLLKGVVGQCLKKIKL